MSVHFEEFLYRGRAANDPREPAWHVVLLEQLGMSGVHGRAVWEHHTLTMSQAEAAGWPLPKIIEAINAELLKECESMRARIAALEEDISISRRPGSAGGSSPASTGETARGHLA